MNESSSTSSEQEDEQLFRDRRRFSGLRYQMQGNGLHPSRIVDQGVGTFPFPDPNETETFPTLGGKK